MKYLKIILIAILLFLTFRWLKNKGFLSLSKIKSAVKGFGVSNEVFDDSFDFDDEENKKKASELNDSLKGINDRKELRKLLLSIRSDDEFNDVNKFFSLYNKNRRTLLEQLKHEIFIPQIKKDVNKFYASIGMFSKV